MFRVAGLLLLLVLSGCAQAQLEHQSDSFNRATANAISEHALLNAVRSSLDMPMSFTKLLKFTAGNMANGSFSPKLPFGPEAARSFDLGPSFSWSGGVGQIEYADANNSGALAKLNQNLQYDTIDRYAYQGLSVPLLMTMFVEHVEIDGSLLAAMYELRRKECVNTKGVKARVCEWLKEMSARCAWPEQIFGPNPEFLSKETIDNRAYSKCAFLRLQAFRSLLILADFWSDSVSETSTGKLKTAEGVLLDVPRKSTGQAIGFANPWMQAAFNRVDRELEDDFKKKKKAGKIVTRQHALAFAYRSPKSLLVYLGELIALQNFSKDRYVPRIPVGKEWRDMTVFRVVRGTAMEEKTALLIRGPDGAAYTVPQPDYGSELRDQTLRVLSIAGEVVNGALSDKDFPAPASVVVRAF